MSAETTDADIELVVELAKLRREDGYEAAYRVVARHRSEQAVKWQPIETAPKDETAMLLACADWPHSRVLGSPVPIKVGGWNLSEARWQIFGASWEPTHWLPLPSAPEATS